jgi:hypothetical protein
MEVSPELDAAMQRMWAEVFPQPPAHTWYRPPRAQKNGPLFGWLTEPLEGKYGSMVWWPKGKGARSNKATMWELVEDLTAIHDTRREARARATRLYEAHYDHGGTLKELIDGSYLDKIR